MATAYGLTETEGLALGSVGIVQSDSRYCNPEHDTLGIRAWPYWWYSVAMNAQWAWQKGYEHLTYCITVCTAADSSSSSTAVLAMAWCKIPVIADVLQQRRHDTILYLDSDAFWNRTSAGMEALGLFFWPGDWRLDPHGGGSIYFGCNLPWAGEDRGRRQWNHSWENGDRGPPNTGVILIRNSAASLATFASWWRAPFSSPRVI